MAEAKTKPTKQSVEFFLKTVVNEQKRKDCQELVTLMTRVTGHPATMWGPSIVGFGKYHYKYDSGHEGESCLAAFSPRKDSLTVYLMPGFTEKEELMNKLGKFKTGKSCLYIKQLQDIDIKILEKLIRISLKEVKEKYPG